MVVYVQWAADIIGMVNTVAIWNYFYVFSNYFQFCPDTKKLIPSIREHMVGN